MAYTVASTTYSKSTLDGSATTAFGANYNINSGFTKTVTLPFSFNFNNQNYTTAYIGYNGFVSFDSSSSSFSYQAGPIPSTSMPPATIFGFYQSDYNSSYGATSSVKYQTFGTTPNRVFVVAYENIPNSDDGSETDSYQIKLFEADGSVEVHIEHVSPWYYTSITEGIQDATSNYAYVANGRNNEEGPYIPDNDAYKFTLQAPVAPTANFSSFLGDDLNVRFKSTSTGEPTSWSWTFGDSTSSTAANPSRTYGSANTYTVNLTVSNSAGSNSVSKSVVVSNIPKERYWVGGSGNFSDEAHWAITSGGTGGYQSPNENDDVYINSSSGSGSLTITIDAIEDWDYNGGRSIKSLTSTKTNVSYYDGQSYGFDYTPGLAIMGDLSTAASNSFSVAVYIDGDSTISVNNSGFYSLNIGYNGSPTVLLNSKISISNPYLNGGTLTLGVDDIELRGLDVSNGATLNTNGKRFLIGQYGMRIDNGGTVDFGTSVVDFANASQTASYGILWKTGNPSTAVINAENATFNIYTKDPSVAYVGGRYNFDGLHIGTVNVAKASYASATITGGAQIDNFNIASNVQILFEASKTITVGTMTATGATFRSGTTGTRFTLSSSNNQSVYSTDIKDSAATGGGTWNAYSSTDSGNNTGWNFLNGPPSVVLDAPANAGKVTTRTPQLKFTGTDAEANPITYEVQVDANNTFDSVLSLIDGYDTTGTSSSIYWQSSGGTTNGGQTFTGNGTPLVKATALFSRLSSSGTGNFVAKIYAITGTAGTNALPTGAALATSTNTYNSSSLVPGTPTTVEFNFDGSFTPVNGTKYAFDISITGGSVTGGSVQWLGTNTYPFANSGHDGNLYYNWGGYTADNTSDAIFAIYSTGGPLIDAFSATDLGFIDITDGADTDPFDSGDQIGYTPYAPVTSTFYFDYPPQGYTPGNVTNPNNMVDGNTATYGTIADGEGSVYFQDGTTAPSTNTTIITGVRGRIHNGAAWSNWKVLTPPEEGWNWGYINGDGGFGLMVHMDYYSPNVGVEWFDGRDYSPNDTMSLNSAFASVSRIEIEVTTIELFKLTDKATYYWRVRAKDPAGSNTWGDWTTARSFVVQSGTGDFLTFFYP